MKSGVEKSINSLRDYLKEADRTFFELMHGQSRFENPDQAITYYIEKTFKELLVLLECLNLHQSYNTVKQLYEKAKNSKGALKESEMGQYDPYLIWSERLADYIDAIANFYNIESDKTSELLQLKEIIKNAVYPITDNNVFTNPPKDEKELHIRLEAILKCIFPDLISKPPISKPIKNFIPDTGIPTLHTLIEYKFISTTEKAKRVADQMLADRSAYRSKDWNKFLFVIYETKRIKPEKEWKLLFRESGVSSNTEIVVLSGVPVPRRKAKKK